MGDDGNNVLTQPIRPLEFHVLYHLGRKRWEVHYSNLEIGFPAWDKRIAMSYAKAEAKKMRPSVVIIHVKGTSEVQDTIEYEYKTNRKALS